MEYCFDIKDVTYFLKEAEFWKKQEYEHTIVIEQITNALEEEYLKVLNEFRNQFKENEEKIKSELETLTCVEECLSNEYLEYLFELINKLVRQSCRFILFLNDMLKNSQTVKTDPVAQTVIKHIIRESEYFYGLAQGFMPYDYEC